MQDIISMATGMNRKQTILDVFQNRVENTPDRIAFTFLSYSRGERFEDNISYRELDERARTICAYLQGKGMTGKTAILLYPEGFEFIAALLGCFYARVTAVPLYHFISKRKADRLLSIIEDSQAEMFLTDGHNLDRLSSMIRGHFEGEFQWCATDKIEPGLGEVCQVFASAEDVLAYLQYTSGSTSTPKGVMITHRNIMHNMEIACWSFRNHADSVGVSWIPHYHDMGLIFAIMQPIFLGYRQILMQPADFIAKPFRFLKAVSDFRGTTCTMPNFAYEHCVNRITTDEKSQLELSSMEGAGNGAEPIHWHTMKSYFESFSCCGWREDALVPGYGLAEATLMVSVSRYNSEKTRITKIHIDKDAFTENRVVLSEDTDHALICCSSGAVRDDIDVRIVNPDTLVECIPGTVGEIWTSSDSVSPGYWKKDEINREIFQAKIAGKEDKTYLRTGDLGFFFDHTLYVSGRMKDVIIIHGANYHPNDIEYTAAHCHTSFVVDSCAAFTVTEDREERLCISLEMERSLEETYDFERAAEVVRKAVYEAHGLQTQEIVFVKYGSLPKTSSGKIQRSRCKSMYEKNELSIICMDSLKTEEQKAETEPAPARAPYLLEIESKLIDKTAALLKVHADGIDRSRYLVSLGFDSITLAMLHDYIEEEFGAGVEMPVLFDCNLSELTQLIANRDASDQKRSISWNIYGSEADHGESFALTDLQNAYWMGRNKEFELGGVSAHVLVCIEPKMNLDVRKLNTAWSKLIVRHPMLRATITAHGQQQVLPNDVRFEICCHDLSSSSEDDSRTQCESIWNQLKNHIISFDSWPWFDIHYVRLCNDTCKIFFNMDLLIADIWSLNTLFREWFRIYNDEAADIAEIRLTYKDYCAYYKDKIDAKEDSKEALYWKARIMNMPRPPSLPMLKREGGEFVHHSFVLEKDLWGSIKKKASFHGVTASAVLLAAYGKVLGLWSQTSSFTLSTTLFNRVGTHPDIRSIVGDFTSVMAVEIDRPDDQDFAHFARKIQRQLASDMQHRAYSGVKVIRELATHWGEKPTEAVLPVVFTSALSSEGQMVFQSEDFFGPCATVSQTPQVFLDYQVYESDSCLYVSWDAIDALFPDGLIQDMFEQHATLLTKLAKTSWEEHITLLLPGNQQSCREGYNATESETSEELLIDGFLRNAVQNPEKTAVSTSSKHISYGILFQSACWLANKLQDMGIRERQIVPVMMEKGWQQVVAVLGIHLAGAAYVSIDPALPKDRKNYLISHCEAKLVLVQRAADIEKNITHIVVDDCILVKKGERPAIEATTDDLAYILYTSGSTGQPKGVAITHRGAVNTIRDVNRRFGVTVRDSVFAISSLSFDLSVYDIFGILSAGGTIVMPDPHNEHNPDHWIELIERHNVTVWNSVPALFEMMVAGLETYGQKIRLDLVMLSGDWIPVGLPDRFWSICPEAKLISLGGATEASIWSIFYPIERVHSDWTSIPYGVPLTNQTFHVLNEHLEACPDWVTGDLYIGGAGLASCYYKDPEKTEKSFVTHPKTGERLYRTGDLGRFRPEGYIEFLGREDSQVKIGGFRIELGEIESVIGAHAEVQKVVVNKHVNEAGNVSLIAYVVSNDEKQPKYNYSSEIFGEEDEKVILNAHDRLMFKLQNPSLRIQEQDEIWQRKEANIVRLASAEDQTSQFTKRISSRKYLDKPLSFEEISALFSSLRKIDINGMKKFKYGSAGGIYPVQVYVYFGKDKVTGFEEGLYYYHPHQNALVPIDQPHKMNAGIHVKANQKIYDTSAFTLLLVGKMSAIKPLYGNKSRDFCLIETGLISQLIETAGADMQIGTCQIGALADQKLATKMLQLEPEHELLHVILGGKVDISDLSREFFETEPDADQNKVLEREILDLCAQKLPHYMIPSTVIPIEEIPLTAVGKVNYKALPPPCKDGDIKESILNDNLSGLEKLIHDVFCAQSGMRRLDTDKSFFDMGINSLTITRAWRDIVENTGEDFPVIRVFENPSVVALARYLSQHKKESVLDTKTDDIQKKADIQRLARVRRASRFGDS